MPLIGFWHRLPNETLTLELYPFDGGDQVASDELMSAEGSRFYSVELEVPEGRYVGYVIDDESQPVYRGIVDIVDGETSLLGVIRVPECNTEELEQAIADLSVQVTSELGGITGDIVNQVSSRLASTKQIVFAVPALAGSELNTALVQGSSYLDDRALTLTNQSIESVPDETTVELRAWGSGPNSTARAFSIAGEIVSQNPVSIAFEITSEQSAEWQPGRYEWQVDLVLPDGNTIPFLGPKIFLEVAKAVPHA